MSQVGLLVDSGLIVATGHHLVSLYSQNLNCGTGVVYEFSKLSMQFFKLEPEILISLQLVPKFTY